MNNYLVFILMLLTINAHSQVLSEWRGLGRTGVYLNENNLLKSWPENGPELLWFSDSIPPGYSSAAVTAEQVFITGIKGDKDVILAFDLQGNKLWEVPYGRAWDGSFEHSRSTPTIEGDRLYVSSGLGDIACLSTVDGTIYWSVKVVDEYNGAPGKFGYSESLLIYGDKVLFTPAGDKTNTVAFSKQTGELAWQSATLNDKASYVSPLVINYKGIDQIINQTETYVFSVNPENGDINWKFDFGQYAGGKNKRNNQANTPLFHNNELFITSGYDHKSVLLALNEQGTDVSVKWVDSVLDVHFGGVVQIDGYIYGANWLHNRMGNWTCLEWDTGKVMFSEEWGNKGSIIAADGMLYCYEEKSGFVGIAPVNPNKFEIVSSFMVPKGINPYWAHPVINNGKLYVRSSTALMVYDISSN